MCSRNVLQKIKSVWENGGSKLALLYIETMFTLNRTA